MKATLKQVWKLLDHTTRQWVDVQPGTYELERIPNPLGHEANWLVIKGTTHGMAEGAWRQWKNGILDKNQQPIDWEEWEIVIEE